MARKRATTKATGGGGYTFADNVAAEFLVHMLRGSTPFDQAFGPPTGIHFETRDSGHILDDLLVALGAGDGVTRGAVSIKSGRQLTAAGFSDEFVQDAWGEWQRPGFDINADLLVLIVGVAVGTRRWSSSSQFWTRMISGGAEVSSATPWASTSISWYLLYPVVTSRRAFSASPVQSFTLPQDRKRLL